MSAVVSSRTPEGVPGWCPTCQGSVCLEPSWPTGDATCPACGTLVWPHGQGEDWDEPERLSRFEQGRPSREEIDRQQARRRRLMAEEYPSSRRARRLGLRAFVGSTLAAAKREALGLLSWPESSYGDVADHWLDG